MAQVFRGQQNIKQGGVVKVFHAETDTAVVQGLKAIPWTASTAVIRNQFAINDGKVYQANSDFTTGATFAADMPSGAEKWTLFGVLDITGDVTNIINTIVPNVVDTNVADWAANTAYKKNKMVINDGKVYQAKADFTSGAAFDEANWKQVGIIEVPGNVVIDPNEPSDMVDGDIWIKPLD